MSSTLSELRRDYALASLARDSIDTDPFRQFEHWFQEALKAEVLEPNAMTLATVDAQGHPSARIVLLKSVDPAGFVFFTNYQSSKGQQLAANPQAALVFFWKELERQVRIEGRVEKISRAESERYFQSRPRGSQIGAAASNQSQVVANRTVLETRFQDLEARYAEQDIPTPAHWGGYRLTPDLLEFWQGRRNRLHDRLRYRLLDSGDWSIERLEP
ncbi:MAG: pyridoxamine 5'-phosphate oxidase [Candidatus Competibacteraceae bacterium]|nr:pyridoxamine 5'-phosphate oxidase [Candidatus Competibacteraceae bacterium]MCB1815109.1 pyridoxamine 5'-phosphate oxidase [Candidatus Competibacteraceae bacterium]